MKYNYISILVFAFVITIMFSFLRVAVIIKNPEIGEALQINRSNLILKSIFLFVGILVMSNVILRVIDQILDRIAFARIFTTNLIIAGIFSGLYMLSLFMFPIPCEFAFEFVSAIVNFASVVVLLQLFLANSNNKLMLMRSNIQKEELEKEKINVELNTLKTQLNPHFLFNALNTLNGLIRIEPERAITYNEHLSSVLRYTIQQRKSDVDSIEDELAFIDKYIILFKHRFGDNLTYEEKVPSSIKDQLIPTLSLQLLVENAIKHNVISNSKPLHIRIFEEHNCLKVTNNINESSDRTGTGLGLDNLKRRYSLILDRNITIDQSNSTFIVSLPLDKVEEI